MRFKDKVCLVVGGSTGIGAATAHALAREGAQLAIASNLSIEEMAPFIADVGTDGTVARPYQFNIAVAASVSEMVAALKKDFGRIDVAVNSAGLSAPDALFDSNPETGRRVYEVNAIGPYYFVHAVAPVMRETGGGAIVLVASASGIAGTSTISAYCASKAAVMQLCRGLVPELRGTGIRLNCIAPGLTRTPMTAFLNSPEGQAYLASLRPLIPSPYDNPWLEPEDQADAILFLASDDARSVQGHCLVTDQGMTAWFPTAVGDPRAEAA